MGSYHLYLVNASQNSVIPIHMLVHRFVTIVESTEFIRSALCCFFHPLFFYLDFLFVFNCALTFPMKAEGIPFLNTAAILHP